MDEPTCARESLFWDGVVEWLLGARELDADLSEADIEAMLRDLPGARDDPLRS